MLIYKLLGDLDSVLDVTLGYDKQLKKQFFQSVHIKPSTQGVCIGLRGWVPGISLKTPLNS